MIPMFQNVSMGSTIVFFSDQAKMFSSAYMPIIVLSMIEGALVTLYIMSWLSDSKKQDATKFDLSS